MNFLRHLATLENLTASEKTLVHYIQQHPHEVLEAKPQTLAAAAYVSVATVYRLINKLSLNGLGELKVELASSLQGPVTGPADIDFPISPADGPQEILHNLQGIYERTIEETLQYADEETLQTVCQLMQQAQVIDVYAAAGNLFFAENFKFQMQELGVLVNVPAEDYQQRLSAANSDNGHFAIVVSFGGRGASTRAVMEILHENQVPNVLLTSIHENPLSALAQHQLYLASVEDHYQKMSSFSTRQSLLMLFDTLYALYFSRDYEKNRQFKLTNYRKINQQLQ